MVRVVAILWLAGCGRLGFDPNARTGADGPTSDDSPSDDGGLDAPASRTCFVEIGVGEDHACARHQDGSAWCWGRNDQGNLGIGTTGGPDLQPARVQAGPFTRLTVGGAHTCVVRADSSVECWGNDGNHVLGVNGSGDSGTPVVIPGLATSELHASGSYACARVGASYRCWGDSDAGQLGDGVLADYRTAHAPISDPFAMSMAHGEDTGCVFVGQSVRCWGINAEGQLAAPPVMTTDQCKDSQDVTNQPCSLAGVALPAFSIGVKQIALGRSHTCAIDQLDEVWCWGRNVDGQLGDGGMVTRHTPMRVVGISGKVQTVVVGASHTCALLANGTVACWGAGINGELGDGLLTRRLVAALVPGLTDVAQLALASGGKTTCALDLDGVTCWGDNPYDIAGTTAGPEAEVPQRVLAGCP